MTKFSSADVGFLLVNGMSILGDVTTLEDTREAIVEEVTPLGVAWEEQAYVGVKRYSLTQQGFYNDATDRSNAALVTPGTTKVLAFAPEGNTVGKKFVGSSLVEASYTRQIARGALHKGNANYTGSGTHDEGIILHAHATEANATGNTEGADSQDNLAGSSAGGAGYLEVSALTLGGYTNLAVIIEHSTDDVTYSTLLSFAVVTAAPSGERKAVTGTVNRYTAMAWSYGGAGAGQSATFMVGFSRY